MRRDRPETRVMRRMAIGLVAVLAPLQVFLGHLSGEVAHEHQPAKVAAMEGWWESGVQSTIFLGWPDDAAETTHVWLQSPRGWGGAIVVGDANAELQGLKSWPASERPPSLLPFWGFRIMVGMGVVMLAMGWWGAWLWLRRRLETARLFHWAALPAGASGFVAVLAGWVTTEVGRQPYVVYGALRTAEAVSPVPAGSVAGSLLWFLVIYAIVFTAGALYIGRLLVAGPTPDEPAPEPPEAPGNPLGVASAPGGQNRAVEA